MEGLFDQVQGELAEPRSMATCATTARCAIALMGPTASGKTALRWSWAQRLGGEIVSVDSALVYRGLDIGAAKPDAATSRRGRRIT